MIAKGTNTAKNECLKYNGKNYNWLQKSNYYMHRKENRKKTIFLSFIKLYDENEPYIITNYTQSI